MVSNLILYYLIRTFIALNIHNFTDSNVQQSKKAYSIRVSTSNLGGPDNKIQKEFLSEGSKRGGIAYVIR